MIATLLLQWKFIVCNPVDPIYYFIIIIILYNAQGSTQLITIKHCDEIKILLY